MTKKKEPEKKPKAELKKDGRLYIFSCRVCKSVHLVDLTYLEHMLRFFRQRRSLEAPEIECPICGASMDQVDHPKVKIHIQSPEQTANAMRLIEVAARETDIIPENPPIKE